MLLLLCCLTGSATAQLFVFLPEIKAEKNSDGKYGYVNSKKQVVIPYQLNYAKTFEKNRPLAPVGYGNNYYLINRRGYIFDNRAYKQLTDVPTPFRYFIYYEPTKNSVGGVVADLHNRPLSPANHEVITIPDPNRMYDPFLFILCRKGERFGYITGLDFKSLSNLKVFWACYYADTELPVWSVTTSSGIGLINAKGELMIPDMYDRIKAVKDDYNTNIRFHKDHINIEELNITFFVAIKGDYYTIYDAAGYRITPPIKGKYIHKVMMKAYKKYLLPYVRSYSKHKYSIVENITKVYAKQRMLHAHLTTTLPQQPRVTSPGIVQRIKNDIAQKELEEQKRIAQRELEAKRQEEQRRLAAQRQEEQRRIAAEKRAAQQRNFMAQTGSIVPPPAANTFPNNTTLYIGMEGYRNIVFSFHCFYSNGEKMIRCNLGFLSGLFRSSEETANHIIFHEGNFFPVLGSFTEMRWKDYPNGASLLLFKDWSRIRSVSGSRQTQDYNCFVTKAEYDKFQQGMQRASAMANSGVGVGGGSAPVQVESGMSASYYQDMYRQYERFAESTYNTLTSMGLSITGSDGSKSGSTMGSWGSNDYSQLKRDLQQAQSNMRRIRSEASRAGYNIPPSYWESASVSY